MVVSVRRCGDAGRRYAGEVAVPYLIEDNATENNLITASASRRCVERDELFVFGIAV